MKILEMTYAINFVELEKAVKALKHYWEKQGFEILVSIHETKFEIPWRIEVWGMKK